MTHHITIRHNAEMAHRLPHLPGKCQSLHGHSWWFTVEITAPLNEATGLCALEFADAKRLLRDWIDTNLDHGICLGALDPLLDLFADNGYKGKLNCPPLDQWPTVEVMARWVGETMGNLLRAKNPDTRVTRCTAQETHVNAATWEPTP